MTDQFKSAKEWLIEQVRKIRRKMLEEYLHRLQEKLRKLEKERKKGVGNKT